MSFEHFVSLFSSSISFIGLMLVVVQLRTANQQRESDSLAKIYDNNRQLLMLGFSHPQLFAILRDDKSPDPEWERYYLQLWLNQFSQIHSYLKRSLFQGELRESLERDLSDFLMMANTQRHWKKVGKFYPASFQDYVNQMIEKLEPPEAAQASPG